MFRLYNTAFSRFPDVDGLKYWINNFETGKDDIRAVASSFLLSEEFNLKYGENLSDEDYITRLYQNIFNRNPDESGFEYWLNNLKDGIEERYEVLIGFSESLENKTLFSEVTSIF